MGEPAISTLGVTEDDLVTGEAVALDLPPASVGLRILSGTLDYLIVGFLVFTVTFGAVALVQRLDAALQTAIVLLVSIAALVGYPVTIETLTRGRSVGKLAAGLRTVRDDAGPITFRHALARGLIWVVEVYLLWGIPAVISCVVTARAKCIGDIAAGTYVVRDRVRASLAPPVPDAPAPGWVGPVRGPGRAAGRSGHDGAFVPAGRVHHDAAGARADGPAAARRGDALRLAPATTRKPP